MKEKIEKEGTTGEDTGDRFEETISAIDPKKGITTMDYLNALDLHVKIPLRIAYLELCGLINELPKVEMERADGFLSIQGAAFMLWEQVDKKIIEDHKAHGAEHDFLIRQRDEWEEKFQRAEEARLIASRHLSYFVSEESAGRLHIDPIPKGANLRKKVKDTAKKNDSKVKRAA